MTSEESRKKKHRFYWLVGGFNPSEKYESHLGLFFPIYGKIKNVPNHQPVGVLKMGGPNGWMVDFDGKSERKMDDDWGCTHCRKPAILFNTTRLLIFFRSKNVEKPTNVCNARWIWVFTQFRSQRSPSSSCFHSSLYMFIQISSHLPIIISSQLYCFFKTPKKRLGMGQNPIPLVNIKIAGIYGCSSH
jgi:hypothetical protein